MSALPVKRVAAKRTCSTGSLRPIVCRYCLTENNQSYTCVPSNVGGFATFKVAFYN